VTKAKELRGRPNHRKPLLRSLIERQEALMMHAIDQLTICESGAAKDIEEEWEDV
jgi:hypothetical protein